jgi:DNA-binding transcriptional LysR family regulator
MLDVKRMRVLREVSTHGSFSAAAEALAYTQSAVSQQIAALEKEAGAKLVDRNARGVRLTDAGHALVRHADVILSRLADAEAELEAIAGLQGGRLRIASLPSAGATMIPRAIAMFRERHPAVELAVEPAEPEDAITALKTGLADIGVSVESSFTAVSEDGIERTPLLDDPMFLVLPACHPLAHKPRVKLEDFADDAWINGTGSAQCPDGQIVMRACNAAGFDPKVAFYSDDYLAVQGFIAAGMGVSLIPDLALISVRDDVVVRSLGARPPMRRLIAITLADSYCSPARSAMLHILQEVGQEFEAKRRSLALAS